MSAVAGSAAKAEGATREAPRGARLWWRLLRAGLSAGRRSSGDRLRFWAVFAAAAAVALVALGSVTAVATYDGRAARNQARGPVITDRQQDAVALWREGFDAVGEVQHTVVHLHRLKAGATPRPG